MQNYQRTNPSSRPPQRQRMLTPRPAAPRHHLPPRPSQKKPEPVKPAIGARIKRLLMHLIGWPIVVLILAALLAEVGVLMLLFGEQDYTGRIYPNITVRGLDLSNHTPETANIALQKRYEPFLENPVEIRYGELSWYPTAEELGISLNFDRAIKEAMVVGRTETRMENTKTVAAVWENGVEVPLYVSVDHATLQDYLVGLSSMINAPSRNADVALQGEHVIITPEQKGLQILVDETMQDITAALQELEAQHPITLRTRKITPVVRDSDISPVVAEISELLAEPIVLTSNAAGCANGCRWTWPSAKIASWLHLIRGSTPDGKPTISVDIDQTGIRNALLPLAESVRRDGTLPRVNWNDGNPTIYRAGLPGQGLDVAMAQSLVNEALQGGSRSVELPITDIPPPVTEANIGNLGITQAVGTGVSSFRNSQPYRITNIRAGARRMHGLLIPPGKEFSFNTSLGPVNASGGFVQGSAIVNDRTQQEWGGGLCQVSTTMFRAAFWTGLPIIERHEHNFRISWYEELGEPPGLDAAIYTGANDVRFINDTGGWLLTQSWVDLNRQRLYITLYGPPVQRRVEMSHQILRHYPAPSEPRVVEDPNLPAGTYKQTDWSQPGLDVEVYRVVWEGGSVLRRDTFPTSFKPWPNIFVRGTGR